MLTIFKVFIEFVTVVLLGFIFFNFFFFFFIGCKVCGIWGFPGGALGKDSACKGRRCKRLGFDSWVGKIPWGRKWQPSPAFLLGRFCGQRSLEGYTVSGVAKSHMIEQACTCRS